MTIRRRLAVAAGVAVAISIALASLVTYLGAGSRLHGAVDTALRTRADQAQTAFREHPRAVRQKGLPPNPAGAPFGVAAGYVQLVSAAGESSPLSRSGGPKLPVSPRAREVAAGRGGETVLEDTTVDGEQLRVLTTRLGGQGAIQVARPLGEVNGMLHELIWIMAAITAGGVVLASALGGIVSRASLAPIRRFTEQTESISSGPDLGRRLEVRGEDELGRLAKSYNATLEALQRSADAQRQMVSDASHELRTPLATLKTNLEMLVRNGERFSASERVEIEADLVEQIDGLTLSVDDVVELARHGEPEDSMDEVDLDQVLKAEIEGYERHGASLKFVQRIEPFTVLGVPSRLARAIHNLLDNAAKWSPSGGEVEVRLQDGALSVRDHGPGIAPEDLPFVFDRFYRSPAARSLRGSGLGLAIVRQTASAHGAEAEAGNAAGGGALLTIRFPTADAEDDRRAASIPRQPAMSATPAGPGS
jgi:two-component system sensor histidine kinase MprB